MKALIRSVKMVIHFILLKTVYWLMFRERRKDGRKWIVLVRSDHLGDMLCSISVLRHFLDYYHRQGYSVALLVNQPYCEFVKRILPCDRVIGFHPKRIVDPIYRTGVMMQLYRMNIDVLVSLVACNIAFFVEIFSFARVKHLTYCPNEKDKLLFYGKYYDFHHVRKCGVCMQDQHERIYQEVTGETASPEKIDLHELLPDLPSIPNRPDRYYVVFPGASTRQHCWEAEKFAALINFIRRDFPEYTAVILGSDYDRAIEQKILTELVDKQNVLELCGKTDLDTLFAWGRDAEFVIGNDSGGIHLAAAWNVPSFSIVHRGDFGSFLPNPHYQKNHSFYSPLTCSECGDRDCDEWEEKGINRVRPCLASITAEEVYAEIRSFLMDVSAARAHSKES